MRAPSAANLSIKYAGARANDFHHLRLSAGVTDVMSLGAEFDRGFVATQCLTYRSFTTDKVSCVFAACILCSTRCWPSPGTLVFGPDSPFWPQAKQMANGMDATTADTKVAEIANAKTVARKCQKLKIL